MMIIKNHTIYFLILLLFINFGNAYVALSANTTIQAAEENPENVKAHQLLAIVKETGRFINRLDSNYVLDFPVGIVANDRKEAEKYAIVISEMKLRNGEAFLTAYMAFTIPGTTKKIAFKGTDIPFSFGGGIKGEAVLELISDFDVELTDKIDLLLKGGGKTKVRWDCFGFKEMDVVADVLFDSTLFVPENPDGSLKSSLLKGSFQTTITDWNNLMVGLSLEPFQIKGLDGVGISITNAVFDLSDFRSPANVVFSPEHHSKYFIDGNTNLWRGLYIQGAQVRLPQQFKKKNTSLATEDSINNYDIATGRPIFYVQNLFIDELGFTGKLSGQRLLTLEEGDLGGWSFSVENFLIEIRANQLISAGFDGQILVPQFSQNSLFNYSATMGLNNTYSFNVAITDSVKLEMWAANMVIEPNSALNIKVEQDKFVPSLLLNGTLSLNSPFNKDDTASVKLAIAKVPFQGMRIQTVAPYFSVDNISFGTEQSWFSKFPISINNIEVVSVGNRIGLNLGLTVNFVQEKDGSFGGSGEFTIWGKHQNNKWQYDHLQANYLSVNIDKGDPFKIKGQVLFIRGDETFGNGFKGTLDAKIAGFGMQATALFGNVDGFRYWYADALITLQTGIAAGPVSIFGFGGGAYYHMRQVGIGTVPVSDIGKTNSGIYYAPDKSVGLGITASVKFGLTGGPNAFNGDAKFSMSFNKTGGIDQISFNGNAYFVTGDFNVTSSGIMENAKHIIGKTAGSVQIPKESAKAPLRGDVSMLYDFANNSFHATFNVFVNVGGIITGTGPEGLAGRGVMHFSPGSWYIHLGTPSNPNGINVMNLARMNNYFMAGTSVPELPPPPDKVREILRSTYPSHRNTSQLANGSGFAFGSSFALNTGDRRFLMFYGNFDCGIGFDILMKNYGNLECAESGIIGINGWYAQGQAYAWVDAAIGIIIDLPFYSGRYSILDMQVAALMQAKAPNPFWLKGSVGGNYNILGGLVKGHCNFEIEIGRQCKVVHSSPFGGVSIIADITPMDKENEVNVFSTPQVMFNLPVNESIQFKDENNRTKTYRIRLDDFRVETADKKLIQGQHIWNNRNDVLVFRSKEILPGETTLSVSVRVRFEELVNGRWISVTKDGEVAGESKQITFTTDKEPDHIPQHNIKYSYPGYRAFNYYRNEINTNYIKLKSGQKNLFKPGSEWIQKARVVPVSGGRAKYFDFTYDANNAQINLSIPHNIQTNTVYRLELVNLPASIQAALDANVESQTETVTIETQGYKTDINVTQQAATESRQELQEKIIYAMEFRTSSFSTFSEKIGRLSYSDAILWETQPLVHSIRINILGERFDSYEVINFHEGTMVASSPLLSKTLWYTQHIQPLFDLSEDVLASVGANPFRMKPLTVYLFQKDGTRILTDNEAETGIIMQASVSSGMNYFIAKYAAEYLHYIQNKIANAYLNSNKTISSAEISKILQARFIPLSSGDYPVNIHYTLPGQATPLRTIERTLRVN